MTLNFQITFDDFNEARTAHAAARRGKRWVSSLILLGLAGLVVVLTLTIRHTPPRPNPAWVGRAVPPPPGVALRDSLLPLMPWLLILIAVIRGLIGHYRRPRVRFIDVTRTPRWQNFLDRYIPAALVLTGVFVLIWPAIRADHGGPADDRTIGALLPVLPWAAVLAFLGLMVVRRTPRMLWNNSPSMERPKTVDADEARLVIRDELATFIYQWSAVTRFVETPRQFLIYTGDPAFAIIPKRAFADDRHVEEFRAVLRDRAGSDTGGFPVLPMPVAVLSAA